MKERSEKVYGAWEDERREELREKQARGEQLTHTEKMSLAIDEVEQ